MAVKIAKKSVTTAAPVAEQETAPKKTQTKAAKAKAAVQTEIKREVTVTVQQVALAEEIAALEAEIAASDYAAKIKRRDELKAQLVSTVGEDDPELKISLPGIGDIVVSKPSKTTIANQVKAQEVMGDDYLKIAKAGVTDLKKYLTPEQQNEVFTYASGDRKCSVKLVDPA